MNESIGENSNLDSGWINVAGKRIRQSPPRVNGQPAKQSKISDYLPPVIPTGNKFSGLIVEDLPDNTQNDVAVDNVEQSGQQPKPPPIIVHNVGQISSLTALLKSSGLNDFSLKTLGNDQIKIQLNCIESYRNVLKKLRENQISLHSYQYKADKPFRVVLRHMHSSADVEEIKEELASKGHTVQNIWNMKHRVSKKPLPMFNINLAPKNNNSEIYKIDVLLHMKVKFEAPKPKREVPQCTRCQSFNHTKSYCNRGPRCVKCTGLHLSKDCPRKEKDNNVQCTNCQENHPANYKGCRIYKQLQSKMFPSLRERPPMRRERLDPSTDVHRDAPIDFHHVNPRISYADVARQDSQWNNHVNRAAQQIPTQGVSSSEDMKELKSMMKDLMSQVSNMLNVINLLVSKIK